MSAVPPVAELQLPRCPLCSTVNAVNANLCWVCNQSLQADRIVMATLVEEPDRNLATAHWIQIGAAITSVVLVGVIMASGIATEFNHGWGPIAIILGVFAVIAAGYTVIVGFSNPLLRKTAVAVVVSVLGILILCGLFIVAIIVALFIACISLLSACIALLSDCFGALGGGGFG